MKTLTTACEKQARWLGLAGLVLLPFVHTFAQPATAPASAIPGAEQKSNPVPASISPGAAEVIRLAQSGVSEDVIKAYIENSTGAFDLSADHILYLRDLGISSDLITDMLNRDKFLRTQSTPSSPPAAAQPAAEVQAAPEPTVPVEAPLTPQSTEVTTPPAQANYFYSDLAPYGTWVDLAGYGWCWQPTVVVINHGWSPYCHGGHWLYTDCGWYWRSDYSWGWAPFHYGRWYMHPGCGWVWMPGAVWAPAWVCWRSYGTYCGWAPLPPHAVFQAGVGWSYNGVHVSASFDFGLHANQFTFIGVKDFNERDLSHHRLEPTQVTKIYNNTTIINNYTVNKTTIINNGIAVERVSAAARTPIQRATVRDLPATSRGVAATASVERGQAVVYRHPLTTPSRTEPVRIQKVDDRHPAIQHSQNVPVVSQQKPAAGGAWGVPPTGTRRESPGAPRTQPRQPGTVEPAPRTPSAPRAPQPTPRQPQPAAAERYSTPQTASAPAREQPGRENQESVRVTPSYRGESPAPGAAAENRERYSEAPPTSQGGNPHVYSPKGHEQFAGSRSMPYSSSHQSAHSSPPPGNSGKQQDK